MFMKCLFQRTNSNANNNFDNNCSQYYNGHIIWSHPRVVENKILINYIIEFRGLQKIKSSDHNN